MAAMLRIEKTWSFSWAPFLLLLLLCGCGSDDDGYSTDIVMASVPEGHSYVGSFSNSEHPEEEPLHTVYFSAFQMSQTEITNAQYASYLNEALDEGTIFPTAGKVYGATGDYIGLVYYDLFGNEGGENRSHILFDGELFSAESGYENWPVTFISWYGAYAFTEHYQELYGISMSLPTEAEWEYTARGGEELEYPTYDGTLSCENANYDCSQPLGKVTVTAAYPANPFGLFDMAGNVREWTWDWYDETFYVDGPSSNPLNLTGTEPPQNGTAVGGDGIPYNYDTRVVRGGSYSSGEDSQRSAYRGHDYPFRLNSSTGFRVVVR